MFTGDGNRSHTARHKLLDMVPNTDRAMPLVRACSEFPCPLRGSLLLAAALARARLVPIRLITSPMLLSSPVRRSTPILLLNRWSSPADPRIVLFHL